MTMGDNIRTIRRNLNLSQQQVATRLNVTQGAISQWEKNRTNPSYNQLIALAKLFNVSIIDIIGINEPGEDYTTQKEMVGRKIKELRKSLGLNQTQFAKPLFVTAGSVSQWELGLTMPDTDRLITMSKVYGVPLGYFIDEPNAEASIKEESAPQGSSLDEKLVGMLMDLPPDQVQLVMAFVSGLRASQSPASSPHPSESEPKP